MLIYRDTETIDTSAWPECDQDECAAHRRAPALGVALCLVVAAAMVSLLAWAGMAIADRVAAECARPAPVSSSVVML